MCVSAISTPALVIFGQELCLLFDHYHHHLLLLQKRLLAELGDADYLDVGSTSKLQNVLDDLATLICSFPDNR